MLTHKQAWRRVHSDNCSLPPKVSKSLNRTTPRPTRSKESFSLPPNKGLRSSLSTSNFHALNGTSSSASNGIRRNGSGMIKSLRYSNRIQVCFISSRADLEPVMNDLFWSKEDFKLFQKEALDEVKAFMVGKSLSRKEAIKALYQPRARIDEEIDDEEVDEESDLMKSISSAWTVVSSESGQQLNEEEEAPVILKTDVELNARSRTVSSDGQVRPTHTPAAGAGTDPFWVVNWKKPVKGI